MTFQDAIEPELKLVLDTTIASFFSTNAPFAADLPWVQDLKQAVFEQAQRFKSLTMEETE